MKFFHSLTFFFLFVIIFFQTALAQSQCKGPKYCSIKSFDQSGITVACNTVSGVYGYRARIKATADTAWQYFMVNAPDTSLLIPNLKTTRTYIVQMGTLCTYSISDTSEFSAPDTAFAFCPCELPSRLWVEKIDSTSVIVKWTPTFDARRFKVFYSNASEGEKKMWQTEVVRAGYNPVCTLTNLKPDTDYEISVRAVCEDRRRPVSILYSPYLKIKTLKP